MLLLLRCARRRTSFFFFFNDTATTEIYPLSLHDALPIYARHHAGGFPCPVRKNHRIRVDAGAFPRAGRQVPRDRKSTRLNSSHSQISYAVFCLKKKKKQPTRVSTKDPVASALINTPCPTL